MLTDQELIAFFTCGFLVYPDEEEDAFLQRVRQAVAPPIHSPILKKIFAIESVAAPLCYSDAGLSFLEAGALFLGDKPYIQLRQFFQTKDHYLGLYTKEEILAHELIHYMRAGFEEPIFEEFIAYQTSANGVRKTLGPLLRSSSEVVYFFLLFPLFFLRLCYFSRLFKKCFQKVGRAILLLKDREIELLAQFTQSQREEWLKENIKSLRIRQLSTVLSSCSS